MIRRPTVFLLACTAAAASALWVVGRTVPGPAPVAGSLSETVVANVETAAGEHASGAVADAVAPSPRGEDAAQRELVDSAPDLDDFAPEQRAAVREILAEGMPDPARVAEIDAAIARLEEDDTVRRALLARELLGSVAILRCDVLAVGDSSVTVRCQSPAPQVGAMVGARRVFELAATPRQLQILEQHSLAEVAAVERGRQQTLLVARLGAAIAGRPLCVLAGPSRREVAVEDETGPAPAGVQGAVDDFEPAARNAVREMLDGRSPWTKRASCALVRCEVVRRQWTTYRSLAALPDLGIEIGDRLQVMNDVMDDVEQHYGLLPQSTPLPGEERTLVVWSVSFGYGLYKRGVLLTSPPLPH